MENELNHLPNVSIVIPSFNQARYLEATLQSIAAQTYRNFEAILIDGGSTDGSVEIIRRYEHLLAYWVSERDRGQTDALIKGFRRSSGAIQCWLNSDDLLEPHACAEAVKFLAANPAAVAVFGNATWIDENGATLRLQREMPFSRFVWLHTYNYIPGMSMFWRRSAYEAAGGLDQRFNLAMDADLWIRLADHGQIGHVRREWSRMRFYSEQKNRRLRSQSDAEDELIRRRYIHSGDPLRPLKRALARSYRIAYKTLTGCYDLPYQRDLTRMVEQ